MSEQAFYNQNSSDELDDLRIPPHSIQAEQSVLGGLMLSNTAWDNVADRVVKEDFYRREHQLIFMAIQNLADDQKPFDVVTLSEELERRGCLDDAGGMSYIGTLAKDTPSAANIAAYADIVREHSVKRQLIRVGTEIADSGFQTEGMKVAELLDNAERKVFEIAEQQSKGKSGFKNIKSLLTSAVDRIETLFEQDEAITGLTTGFNDLDGMTSGLQKSDLIIVAGRPSMGKCIVSGSELVDPSSGAIQTIDTMVAERISGVLSLSDDFKIISASASQFVDDGLKPVFKVITALGRTIETTITHPFLTGNGWKKLEQISEGDAVAVPRILPVFGHSEMPDWQVKTLAYFISDGGTTQSSPLFTNTNAAIVEDFSQAVSAFGGISINRTEYSDRAASYRVSAKSANSDVMRQMFSRALNNALKRLQLSGRQLAGSLGLAESTVSQWRNAVAVPMPGQYDLLLDSLDNEFDVEAGASYTKASCKTNPVTNFLREQGLWGKYAFEKAIPSSVFELPQNKLALFLNRLFACDGGVFISKTGQVRIGYGTASEKLARQVQHLLLRFGILAKFRSKQHHERVQFEVEVLHTPSIACFLEQIAIKGKEDRVSRALKLLGQRKQYTNLDAVPDTVIDYILALKGNRSWRDIFAAKGMVIQRGYNLHLTGKSHRHLSRARLALFARLFDDDYLYSLAESNVYWDKIVSIEYQGLKQVYDLTVPELHNFIAQDICVHNTTFAMNLAENVSISSGMPVAVFSLEMPGEQLVMRMLSSLGRIDQSRLRTGKLHEEEWPRLTSAVSILHEANLHIDDTASLTPTEIRARSRRLAREHGDLGLIVIDYLQLMQAPGAGNNRTEEISVISRSLKALAKELNVPVIALSQLNRNLEQRPNKRPVNSDLRESGSIEQDADIIMFVYRDEVYNEDSPDKGIAEIIIGKQRNGPIGTCRLTFLGQFTKFENFIDNVYSEDGYYE
jgi:replicative DNA helicase